MKKPLVSGSLKGFTVLEFLIVVGIMVILISIVLVGLSSSRVRARDDRRIARIQTVAIAIEDFAADCRTYPLRMDLSYACPSDTNLTLGRYISDFNGDDWNQPGGLNYVPISYGSGVGCTGYHLWVQLENQNNSLATGDANWSSIGQTSCLSDGVDSTTGNPSPTAVNGVTDGIYDLHR